VSWTTKDDELVLEEQRFSDDGSITTGPAQVKDRCDEVTEQDDQIVYRRIIVIYVSRMTRLGNPLEICDEQEFASHTRIAAARQVVLMTEVSTARRKELADDRGDSNKKDSGPSRRMMTPRCSIVVRDTVPTAKEFESRSSMQMRFSARRHPGPAIFNIAQLSDWSV
jgi:hypothetical protein